MTEIEINILQRLLKEEIVYDGDLGNPPVYINGNNQLTSCVVCGIGTIAYFEIGRMNFVCPHCALQILKEAIINLEMKRKKKIEELQKKLDCDVLLPMYRACLSAKIDALNELLED